MRWKFGTTTLALVALAGLTACDPPPPPPPAIEVNSTAPGADVLPGDGICETAPDGGVCTLPAAIQEANALGRALILVPWTHDYYAPIAETITGHVEIRGVGAPVGNVIESSAGDVQIDQGATLILSRLAFGGAAEVRVEGTLVATGTGFYLPDGILIEPTGTAFIHNSLLWRIAGDAPLVTNRGTLVTLHSTLVRENAPHDSPALVLTEPGASTTLGATRLNTAQLSAVCAGERPVSLGHNSAGDASCGLTSPGDQPGTPPGDDTFLPFEGSPAIDAIPVGTLGCGEPGQIDVIGKHRPYDGDGDGVPACDIGAWEWNPGSE
jgi:hypothetical protein